MNGRPRSHPAPAGSDPTDWGWNKIARWLSWQPRRPAGVGRSDEIISYLGVARLRAPRRGEVQARTAQLLLRGRGQRHALRRRDVQGIGGDRRGARALQRHPGVAHRDDDRPRAVLHGADRERGEPREGRQAHRTCRVFGPARSSAAGPADRRGSGRAGLRDHPLVRAAHGLGRAAPDRHQAQPRDRAHPRRARNQAALDPRRSQSPAHDPGGVRQADPRRHRRVHENRARGEHQGRLSPRGIGVEFASRALMPTATSPRAIDRKEDLAALKSLWKEIKDDLLRLKESINEEIRDYPTPIPRCDAQFNHLYERQAKLARELDRIAALAEKGLEREDYIELIERFIASAPYADDAAEQELRSRLKVVGCAAAPRFPIAYMLNDSPARTA